MPNTPIVSEHLSIHFCLSLTTLVHNIHNLVVFFRCQVMVVGFVSV